MEYKHTRLSMRFQDATGCTPAKADHLTHRYLTLCLSQVLRHLNKDAGNRVYVSTSEIQNKLQSVMVKGKIYEIYQTFQSFEERILVPIQIGSNLREELTMAELNYGLEELLIAQNDHQELFKELYKDFENIQDGDVEYIPIDMFSLVSFIKGNLNQTRTEKNTATLNNYLYHALRIKLIAQAAKESSGQCVMPHVVSESQFGRKYYKGPNLQNTPKIVRHAALGTCHEYDIESSVFAWKYSWFKQICKDNDEHVSMPATLEYLDYKKSKRKQLARLVFGNDEDGYVNIIKEAITAIGFGAPARSTGYVVKGKYEPSALNSIIKSKTLLDRFLEDSWVQEFIKEQQGMNSIIIELSKLQGMEPHFKSIPEMLDKAGRLRSNSIVSYLYQQTERRILEYIMSECEASEIMLTVHDCIYTRRPVKLVELRSGIKEFGQSFDISHDEHKAYAYDDELEAHRAFIAEEERLTAEAFNAHGKQIHKPDRKTNFKTPEYNSDRQACDGGHWDGLGYENYHESDDPFLDGMTEAELKEYRRARQAVIGQSQHPDWVQDLIKANRV